MAYLSQPTSVIEYGVVKIGNNISVTDGIISLDQYLGPNANVTFNEISVSGNLSSNGNQVVTSVTPSSGSGISLSNVVTSGPDTTFTIVNTGVLKLTAGSGITLSSSTGNITVSSVGADLISVVGTTANYTLTANDEYVGVDSTNAVTVSLPVGVDGRVCTVKDEHGQGSGKITIKPVTGEKVDGANTYIISVPYQSVSIVFRAGQWRMI